jgi:hypothetical protein
MPYTMYYILCTIYYIQYTLYIILYTIYFILYTIYYTLYTTYNILSIPYTTHNRWTPNESMTEGGKGSRRRSGREGRQSAVVNLLPTSERRGNRVMFFNDFYLKAQARVWPRLSCMCHVRSAARWMNDTMYFIINTPYDLL